MQMTERWRMEECRQRGEGAFTSLLVCLSVEPDEPFNKKGEVSVIYALSSHLSHILKVSQLIPKFKFSYINLLKVQLLLPVTSLRYRHNKAVDACIYYFCLKTLVTYVSPNFLNTSETSCIIKICHLCFNTSFSHGTFS